MAAFLKLVRWPNLLFIALTQIIFYYCFIYSDARALNSDGTFLRPSLFFLLVLASVLIAAAGYIINDYFDLNIDKINKPKDIIVGNRIGRRWAIVWHLVFTLAGVALSFYIGYKINNWLLGIMNLLSAVLLWFYSTTFKRELMIGNIIVSLLTSWVVLVLYFCELHFFQLFKEESEMYKRYISRLFIVAVLYGGFAFIISMIREVIKDLEDVQGDEKYGCKTMPIVWGVAASKIFITTWLVVLIATLGILQFYVLQRFWWWFAVYTIVFIISPLLVLSRKLFKAVAKDDYHKLSSGMKLVMLTGILSMIFFKIYVNSP